MYTSLDIVNVKSDYLALKESFKCLKMIYHYNTLPALAVNSGRVTFALSLLISLGSVRPELMSCCVIALTLCQILFFRG